MSNPWDRRRYESSKAYAAFCVYRDLGPDRSLVKAAELSKPSPNLAQFKWWSRKNDWASRAQAYDDELERQKRAVNERARLEMAERDAKMAMLVKTTVLDAFRSIKAEDLTPDQAIRWFVEAVKIERLARGEPTQIEKREHSGPGGRPIELQTLTDAQLRAEFVKCFLELGKNAQEAENLAIAVLGKAEEPERP